MNDRFFDEKLRDLFAELFYFYRNLKFMKQIIPLILSIIFLFSCGKRETFKPRDFIKVEIETFLQDSLLNVRAIEITNDDNVFFLTSNGFGGVIYYTEFDDKTNVIYPIPMLMIV